MDDAVAAILGLAFIAFIVWIVWLIYALVWQMAQDRGHNPWGWLFISLFMSPFGAIFTMWLFFPIDKFHK
ncbi:MAG: hypothetical protein COB39_06970 [Marinosulfonomonas sp.]|nr:MAG: hypothetical protein COB39_06970 [Marinosulfonomonas sp.]